MLKQAIGYAGRHDFLREDFQAAYDFLRRVDLGALPAGRYEVNARVFALVQEYDTEPANQIKWEAHDKYYDVQYLVSGRERFLVMPRASLQGTVPYDAASDIVFFAESDEGADEILLLPGELVIVAPEEAHKPRCADGASLPVKKVVVKVPAQGQ